MAYSTAFVLSGASDRNIEVFHSKPPQLKGPESNQARRGPPNTLRSKGRPRPTIPSRRIVRPGMIPVQTTKRLAFVCGLASE
jgi:hypothetical protein